MRVREVIVMTVLAGCSFTPRGTGDPSDGPSGGDDVDGPGTTEIDADPIAPDAAVLGPWSAPTMIELSPTSVTDDDPSLTADQLELYMNSSRSGNPDVYVATRAAVTDPWGQPARVPMVSSASNETTPEVAPDGLTLYFASDRAGGAGDMDIWVSTRASRTDPWGAPVVVSELSSAFHEACPSTSASQRQVVITSYRDPPSLASDIFLSRRDDPAAVWGVPVAEAALNTPDSDRSPCLTADARSLYLDRLLVTGSDLYVATRASDGDPFPAAVPITELNTGGSDEDPWVSPDGRTIVFYSDRSGTGQLWQATR